MSDLCFRSNSLTKAFYASLIVCLDARRRIQSDFTRFSIYSFQLRLSVVNVLGVFDEDRLSNFLLVDYMITSCKRVSVDVFKYFGSINKF